MVSVIIVNYNYGRFLGQAVASVFAQAYPNIECIVVDNASTDNSAEVLRELAKEFPTLSWIQRGDNGGQSVASIEGFARSSGEYVVFLDADDFLLPGFIETHVFVHLSLRVPVGLSSSDMVQTVDARVVLGSCSGLSDYVRSGRGKCADLIRRVDARGAGLWSLDGPSPEIENQIHLVRPYDVATWCWSPTSGNCFRRDALRLFLNNKALAALPNSTDAYLIRGVSVLTGSVLIDRPLSAYRLHGTNQFSQHPHLNGVVNYDRCGQGNNDQLSRVMLIDHFIANIDLFLSKSHAPENFIRALVALDEVWPPTSSTVPGCSTYLAGKLVTESETVARALEWHRYMALLTQLKIAKTTIVFAIFARRLFAHRKRDSRAAAVSDGAASAASDSLAWRRKGQP
ncbi:glycosyltransferase family 2 protein [Methylocapsa acidiphila]|uniref:glycosyltransferase family 2 protein n=1 Tax=Methylocapsa acidiphila TaxID=133552 RepID=UPI0006840A76|nr:glycosyltransferase family 2 protein [Methylocapsa acidiphila]